MLRIKKERLQELEKFGFKYKPPQGSFHEEWCYFTMINKYEGLQHLSVQWPCGKIVVFDNKGDDKLFDLIQADIVEKVEDK